MTVLATLSDALAAADRGFSQLRRAWQGATGAAMWPPVFISSGGDGSTELSENRVISYADSVATHPVIYAVWSKLVRNLATTDVGVYRVLDDRRLERVHGTSLETLLREPAPGRGLTDLLQWLFNPYFVEGNSLLGKFRERGPGTPPTNLIPLDWRYMTALARPGGPVEYWVSYQIGEAKVLDPAEVVHLAWNSPDGSEIGPSPLRALGTTIRLADSASRYQTSSFDNGVRPSGAIVYPKEVETTPEERLEAREEIERRHRGVDQAFRLAVLFGGVDWKPMSFSAAEAELINTLTVTREEVCIALDCKRSVITDSDAAGRAVEEILRDFQRSLLPHTALLVNAIQRQVIDPEPEWRNERLTVRLDLGDVVRGTFREEVETAVHGYTNGLLSEDEARERVGYTARGTEDSSVPRVPYAQLQPGRDGRSLPPSRENETGPATRPAGS